MIKYVRVKMKTKQNQNMSFITRNLFLQSTIKKNTTIIHQIN